MWKSISVRKDEPFNNSVDTSGCLKENIIIPYVTICKIKYWWIKPMFENTKTSYQKIKEIDCSYNIRAEETFSTKTRIPDTIKEKNRHVKIHNI